MIRANGLAGLVLEAAGAFAFGRLLESLRVQWPGTTRSSWTIVETTPVRKRSPGTEAAPRSAGAIPGTLDLLIRRAISQERWRAILAPYEGADDRRSLLQLAVTLVLYGAAWAAMLRSPEIGYWLTAIVALPAAGLMVRLIIIQHDCGHGSYFTSQRVCNAVGSLLGILVLTPYDHWRTNHALHHAHAGNLDNRAGGDVATLTVTEYGARGWRDRLAYRLIRNPVVMIGVLILLQFVVVHRLTWGMPRSSTRERRSVWWTNAALAAALAGIWLTAGAERLQQVVIIQGLVMLYGCAFAGWINHTQHQFEDAYWRRSGEWDFFDAGLRGSSWLSLPKPLQWLTASIGLHHVHHLSTRIPNYRLQRCHDENPELWSAHRITLRGGLKALNLALWDERRGKLISFGEYRRLAQSTTPGA